MEFRILGPPEVATASGPVRLAGQRQCMVLAVLLANAHQVVSIDHLVDALWEERPPATARRQVRNCVSALGRALGDRAASEPAIVAVRSGYRIRPLPGELDAQVFADSVAAALANADGGQVLPAVAELRSALKLWRGPALAGLTGRVAQAAAAGLEELRNAALERCLELELSLGRHPELIGELTELVAVNPLRERLVEQLMVALHRCGRRAEALQAYHRLRASLADELGLDPSTPLQDLHGAILADDPAIASTSRAASGAMPIPAQLPADVTGFTGRIEYLHRLDELIASGSQATVVVLVLGSAGVGKTSLAVRWAHQVADRFPDGQLYVNLRGFDPGGSVPHTAEVIRGFLDAFAVPPERIPASLHGQVGMYRSLLAGRRVLVVLDNARNAEQIRPLLPGAAGCLVLVTSRDRLAGLVAAEGAHPVGLDRPSPQEARELLARRLGDGRVSAEPAAVESIIADCDRLPLALAIAAARAAAYPRFPLATVADALRGARSGLDVLDGGDPATDVRAVFSWSYRTLGEEAARLFRLLALHPGPDIAAAAAGSLAGITVRQAQALLDELARVHLIEQRTPGRFSFHDLLRAYARELVETVDAQAERHAATHRMLDHYLHAGYAADRVLDPSRDPIAVATPVAGTAVEPVTGQEQALAWFSSEHIVLMGAIRHAAAAGFDTHVWQLAWSLVDYFDRRGHWQDAAFAQQAALAAAQRLGDRAAQAGARRLLGLAYTRQNRHTDAHHHLGRALELYRALGDHSSQGRTHVCVAWLCERQGRYPEALQHATRGLDLYVKAGHLAGQGHAHNMIGWCHTHLGDHQRAIEHCEHALVLFEKAGARYGIASTLDSIGLAHHHLGQHDAAIERYEQALDLYRMIGDRYGEAETLTHLSETLHTIGYLVAGRDVRRRAVAILDELGHPDADEVRADLDAD